MKSRGYTIAFLAVLIVICLGLYLAISSILSARGAPLISLATPTPTWFINLKITYRIDKRMNQTLIPPQATSTPFTPTPAPPTVTPIPPSPTLGLIPSPAFPRIPRLTLPSNQLTDTPTLPSGEYQYMQDGPVRPDTVRGCRGGSIFGYIRDAEGHPLEGVRVKVYNEWYTTISGPSKPKAAPDAGFYDVILNAVPTTWYVVVVNGGNQPISQVVTVTPAGVDTCHYQVDWRRTY